MSDAYERTPDDRDCRVPDLRQLYFYLTEGCNLACRHCWIAPRLQRTGQSCPSLPVDLFRSIIEQARPLGLVAVKLTGGEPLLHPQIGELLDIVRQEELRLAIETNGVLCTPERAEQIARCGRPLVSVSLDGADASTHEWVRGVPGCFEAAQQGIRCLREAGVQVQVILSVMRCNHAQLEQFVELARTLGVSLVKLNVVQPTARGEELHRSGAALTLRELVELGRWVERDLSPRAGLPVVFDHPMAFRPLGQMFGGDGLGCSTCGILGILGVLAGGSYALCGIGETFPELTFGDARRERLAEVWQQHRVLEELRRGMPQRLKGVCSRCLVRSSCMGGCIAQNYSSSKDLWAPFWFCEEAEHAGLFPESRLIRPATQQVPGGGPELRC